MPIQSTNILPILDQSANPSPICKSITNLSVHHQSKNSMQILDKSANPSPICQSITNPPIQFQSSNPIPILDQSANPGPIFQPLLRELVLYGVLSNPPSVCCHPRFSPSPIHQRNATWTISQPHIYQRQPSKQNKHRLTAHRHALTKVTPIGGQSEDNCPTNLGTSVLYEPTEVSRRRTIQTIHFRRDATPAPIIFCHSANIDQSANPMSIRG